MASGYSKYNYAGSAIQGSGTGAAVGSAAGPYGALIGGGVGLIAGIFQAAAEEENYERRQQILQLLQAETNATYAQIEQAFNDFYENYQPGGTQEDAIEAAEKIRNYDEVFTGRLAEYGLTDPDALKFNYDKTVEDFLNPYMDSVIDRSNQKVQHSAAGAGLGRSTGAAKAISENTAREYDQIYNTALDAYYRDRGQAYNEFQGYLDNATKLVDTLTRNDQWSIEQQKQLGQDYLDWEAQKVQNQAGLAQDKINTKTQITLASL